MLLPAKNQHKAVIITLIYIKFISLAHKK